MKMKQKKIRKIGIASALGLVVLVMLGLYGASNYMDHWKKCVDIVVQ